MRALLFLSLAMTVGLTACQESPDANPAPVSQPPVSAAQPAAQQPTAAQPSAPAPSTAAAPTPSPERVVAAEHTPNPRDVARQAQAAMAKASTSYATLRKQLEQSGWTAMGHAGCPQNVAFTNAAQLCAALPELISCDGQGTCRMMFQQIKGAQTQTLTVVTQGTLEDWNVEANSRLVIQELLPNAPLPATPAAQ